jgi:hypothetical protein
MSEIDNIEARFLRDTATHKMVVDYDNGASRRLVFRRENGGSPYWFEIITWPGSLCIGGDMGCYVFSRLTDMFEFFRMDKRDFHHKEGVRLQINRGYWAEKCVSASKRNHGITEFSIEKFKENVLQHLDDAFEGGLADAQKILESDDFDEDDPGNENAKLLKLVMDEVLCHESECDAMGAVCDFKYQSNDSKAAAFEFTDFFEHDNTEYTFHYLWCLYAIAFAIEQYDIAKTEALTVKSAPSLLSVGEVDLSKMNLGAKS